MTNGSTITELYNRLYVNRRITLRCVDLAMFEDIKRKLGRKQWALNGLAERVHTLTGEFWEAEQKAVFKLVDYTPPMFQLLEEEDEQDVLTNLEQDQGTGGSSPDLSQE